jgi:hypothetical protein
MTVIRNIDGRMLEVEVDEQGVLQLPVLATLSATPVKNVDGQMVAGVLETVKPAEA